MFGASQYPSAATKSPKTTPQKKRVDDRQLKREIQNLKEENAALKRQVLQGIDQS